MSKVCSMHDAIREFVPDGASVAMGLEMEQKIPFAAGHEMIRQKKRGLALIGPISDILFDQLIAAGSVEKVIAAWSASTAALAWAIVDCCSASSASILAAFASALCRSAAALSTAVW